MHLAYSALRNNNQPAGHLQADRYQGYLAACQKHQDTIAEIQKYLPGWRPTFNEDLKSLSLRGTKQSHTQSAVMHSSRLLRISQ